MPILLAVFLVRLTMASEYGINWSEFKQKMANAVKTAENNKKNFGVLSVKTANPNGVLARSVSNNLQRFETGKTPAPWIKDKPAKFVDFMQERWAPVGAKNDPGNLNANWAGNVRSAISKQTTPEQYQQYKDMNLVENQAPWMNVTGVARA
jgi:hypothetical protein